MGAKRDKEVSRMAKLFGSKEIDLLEGPLFGKIFRFVLPLMITNLLQVFYSAADMIIVGFSGVDGAIGAIGTTGAMINLILNLCMGFSVGANVVVARNIGRGDREATSHAVHTSLLMGLLLGIVCGVLGFFCSHGILAWLGDEGHILTLATLYCKIYFLGAPFLALSNYLIAILRAKGDTSTPLFILTGTGLVNVGLNLLFVLVFGMSVDGVALATVLSNALSTVLLANVLMRDTGWCRLSLSRLRPERGSFREILKVGVPAGLQGAVFSLSNMLIQSSIIGINNTLCPGGSEIIDGNAAASNLEGFAYVATNAVHQASVTFTSQHYGASKYKRIGRVMLNCYAVTFLISMACTLVLTLLRKPLIGLYVDAPLAVETAELRTFLMILPYFLLAFMEVGSGVLRGLGKSLTSTVISLLGCCALRVLWLATIFQLSPTLETVYISYPITWIVTAACHFLFSETTRRRYIRRQQQTA